MAAQTAEFVQELHDRAEIHDVLMRYCRGVDRLDEELVRSAFHQESTDDHGYWKGTGWDFAAFIVANIAGRSSATTHAVANELIELHGDEAHVESYVFAYLVAGVGTESVLNLFAGRYMDVFARRDGHWRIASRTVVHDWSRQVAAVPESLGLPMIGFTQGRRDREDLVYAGGAA